MDDRESDGVVGVERGDGLLWERDNFVGIDVGVIDEDGANSVENAGVSRAGLWHSRVEKEDEFALNGQAVVASCRGDGGECDGV